MLPKKYRLTKNKDFRAVYENGNSVFLPALVMRYEKKRKSNLRFGFVVSSKIAKKNVPRNRIKRQLRSIVHQKIDKISPGFDCIIIARPGIKKHSYQQIERDVESLFKKSKIYKK